MKKILIKNYWLMIISWGLFLNDKDILGIIIGAIACVYLLFNKKRINCYRVMFIGFMFFVISCALLLLSNIPYFFPKLHILLMIVGLNTAIANEYLNLLKNKFILPVLSFVLLITAITCLLIMLLPDYLYTIFTKNNLYLMVSFIFLPYLIPLVCAAIINAFKYKEDNCFQKQGAIN